MSKIDFAVSNVNEIGQVIRKRRKNLGLTQVELGEILGKSNTYLSDIEVGKTIPSLKTLIIICKTLSLEFIIMERTY